MKKTIKMVTTLIRMQCVYFFFVVSIEKLTLYSCLLIYFDFLMEDVHLSDIIFFFMRAQRLLHE